MNIKELIKIGCIKENISLAELARRMGTTKQNLGNKLSRNDFKFSDIEKIFSILHIELKAFGPDGKEL